MKGTIKRFTSLMLALLMTLALLPMEVLAAENVSDFTQLTELTRIDKRSSNSFNSCNSAIGRRGHSCAGDIFCGQPNLFGSE